MQRRLFLNGSAAVLAAALAGCGGGGDAADPTATIAKWGKSKTHGYVPPPTVDPAPPPVVSPVYTFQQEFDDASLPFLRYDNGPFNPYFTYYGGPAQPDGPGGYRWWNDELEVYTDERYTPAPYNPYSISNSVLTITGRPAAPDYPNSPNVYVSGNLDTAKGGWWVDPTIRAATPGFEQKYGYWEIRAKMPPGKGLWCSFWLAGGIISGQNGNGELDIFETIGDGIVHQTVHDWWAATDINDSTAYQPAGFDYTQWHTYGLRWSDTEIVWYVDGVETKRASDATVARYRDLCGPMYLVTGMGMGGPTSWGGSPDSTTPFPAQMQIDYIRVQAL